MADVPIKLTNRTYRVHCDDADAPRLVEIAAYVESTLRRLTLEHGTIADERLAVLAALTLADELFDARRDVDELLAGTDAADTVEAKLEAQARQLKQAAADMGSRAGVRTAVSGSAEATADQPQDNPRASHSGSSAFGVELQGDGEHDTAPTGDADTPADDDASEHRHLAGNAARANRRR